MKRNLEGISLKQRSRGKPIKKSIANKPFTHIHFVDGKSELLGSGSRVHSIIYDGVPSFPK